MILDSPLANLHRFVYSSQSGCQVTRRKTKENIIRLHLIAMFLAHLQRESGEEVAAAAAVKGGLIRAGRDQGGGDILAAGNEATA